MKKPLLLSSLVGLIAGFGLALPANPIRFQTPLAAINNPVQTIPEPDTPTQNTVELLNAGADFQDNTVTLNFVTDFQSTPQTGEDILPEMLSELANMSVKSLNVQGDGSLTLALDQVMPIHSTLSIVSDGLYGVVMPDDREEVPMTIQSQIDLKIESQ